LTYVQCLIIGTQSNTIKPNQSPTAPKTLCQRPIPTFANQTPTPPQHPYFTGSFE